MWFCYFNLFLVSCLLFSLVLPVSCFLFVSPVSCFLFPVLLRDHVPRKRKAWQIMFPDRETRTNTYRESARVMETCKKSS